MVRPGRDSQGSEHDTCRATLNQVLYFVGLKSTTPTVACALTNTLPALTFVMAAALKMETVRPGTPAGQAKLVGTAVCVGGSMIIPFYKGPVLRLWESPIHWRFAEHTSRRRRAGTPGPSSVTSSSSPAAPPGSSCRPGWRRTSRRPTPARPSCASSVAKLERIGEACRRKQPRRRRHPPAAGVLCN
ncbi:hypothetical protein SEVIR_9G031500v4 [Setaria viridis]|uniref:WAT1-related protein n=1 Tax=Setaria viridis TaxID=4556 RepID=A0A4U6SPF0_SETVI|nr:protein WALLS ARE THIN 1-like [Setaria viridis]XP_034576508.1 protein WALLS ARE THIN 1-like [Setaria viridis]TKV90477.1 hypothetical protein SEVIR_9G031500v2 [Setaria viridis]